MGRRLTIKDIEDAIHHAEALDRKARRRRYWRRSILAMLIGLGFFIAVRILGLPKWVDAILASSPFVATSIDLLFYSGLE